MMIYLNGLVLGLSLITALGPQNIFLMRQGVLRKHAALSAVTCFLCDAVLVIASVCGLQRLFIVYPNLQTRLTWCGAAFLLYYGITTLRQAMKSAGQRKMKPINQATTHWHIIFLGLSFSLLNPHAIIDSLILIGGGSSQFPGHQQAFFLGVISSSLLWFTSLTMTTHYFADVLSRGSVWRGIEWCSGLLMMTLSVKLAWSMWY